MNETTPTSSRSNTPEPGPAASDWAEVSYDPVGFPPSVPGPNPVRTSAGLAVTAALLFPPVGVFGLYLFGQANCLAALGDLARAAETAGRARAASITAIALGGVLILLLLCGVCGVLLTPTYPY